MTEQCEMRHVERADANGSAESWELFEIDRQLEPARLEELQRRLVATLDDVRVAVADWPAMRAAARGIAEQLTSGTIAGVPSAAATCRRPESLDTAMCAAASARMASRKSGPVRLKAPPGAAAAALRAAQRRSRVLVAPKRVRSRCRPFPAGSPPPRWYRCGSCP